MKVCMKARNINGTSWRKSCKDMIQWAKNILKNIDQNFPIWVLIWPSNWKPTKSRIITCSTCPTTTKFCIVRSNCLILWEIRKRPLIINILKLSNFWMKTLAKRNFKVVNSWSKASEICNFHMAIKYEALEMDHMAWKQPCLPLTRPEVQKHRATWWKTRGFCVKTTVVLCDRTTELNSRRLRSKSL